MSHQVLPEPKPKSNSKSVGDLKWAVNKRFPHNLTVLEWFCKEEWANITKSRCGLLTDSYPKRWKLN